MRRLATGLAWGVLLLGLVGVGLYLGLRVVRGIAPPVVAVWPDEAVPGWSPGDAVLLRRAPIDAIEVGDVVAVESAGRVQLGVVEAADQEGSTVEYVLSGFPNRLPVDVVHADVVGRPDRTFPLAGWVLLALSERVAQLGAVLVAVLLVLGLLLVRQEDEEEALGEPVWATGALALPAGRDRSEPFIAAPPAVAYGDLPMSITPDDLRQVEFAQTKRGYDTEAVDRALDSVADSIEQLLVERQQMLERLQQVEAEVERYRSMEASLTQTLSMAERTAEEMKAEAQAEAQRIVAAASQQAASTAAVPPDAMLQLLGETRAVRALLQAALTQGIPPMPPQQPQAPQQHVAPPPQPPQQPPPGYPPQQQPPPGYPPQQPPPGYPPPPR